MIVAIKLLASLASGIAILIAMVFGVASTMSLNSSDPIERRDATLSAFWSLVIIGLCAAAIVSLTGCTSYEGEGFNNSGRPRNVVDCMRRDARGHEVWYSVPAGRPCR